MAKKVGSEGAEGTRITRDGAPPPGTGDNVTPELYLRAVKEIGEARRKVKLANDELKHVRKGFKHQGIELGVLDAMVKMADWSRGEIRDHFETQRRYAEWLGLPAAPTPVIQGEFKGLDDEEIARREAHAMGRTASRLGQPGKPPEELDASLHQAWLQGFNDEDEAAWADAEGEGDPGAAADDEGGEEEPAKDAKPQPAWKGFSDNPEDWFAAQWKDFMDWYDGLGDDEVVKISHQGVLAAFRAAKEGKGLGDSYVHLADAAEPPPKKNGKKVTH